MSEETRAREEICEALHTTLPTMAQLESGLANVTSGQIADAILAAIQAANLSIVETDRLERLMIAALPYGAGILQPGDIHALPGRKEAIGG